MHLSRWLLIILFVGLGIARPLLAAPVATNDSYTAQEDTPLTVAAPGVLANDSIVYGPTVIQYSGPPCDAITDLQNCLATRNAGLIVIEQVALGTRTGQEFYLERNSSQTTIHYTTQNSLNNAVYTLLDHLGFRWYGPGEDWFVQPAKLSLATITGEWRGPSFRNRGFFGTGGLDVICPLDPANQYKTNWYTWKRRNRFSADFEGVGHTGQAFYLENQALCDAHFHIPAQPGDWFNSESGKVNGRIKIEIADAVAAYKDWIHRKYDGAPGPFINIGVDPEDGRGGSDDPLPPDGFYGITGWNHADKWWWLANEVSKDYDENDSHITVSMYAYGDGPTNALAPKFTLRKNVYPVIIPYAFQTAYMPNEMVTTWASTITGNMGIYDYWNITQWSLGLPQFYLHGMQDKLTFWDANKINGIYIETTDAAGPMGHSWWISGQLQFNLDKEFGTVYNQYLTQCFGAAAPAMKKMFDRWSLNPQGAGEVSLSLADLAEADALVAPDSPEWKRINELKAYVHYMKMYYAHDGTQASKDAIFNYLYSIHHLMMVQTSAFMGQWYIPPFPNVLPSGAGVTPLTDAQIHAQFLADLASDPKLYDVMNFQFDHARVSYTEPIPSASWRFGRNPTAYFMPQTSGTISFDAGCEGHDTPFILYTSAGNIIDEPVGTGNFDYTETIGGRTWHMKQYTLNVTAGTTYYARFRGGFNRFKMHSEIVVFNAHGGDDFDNYAYPPHYFYVPQDCTEIIFYDGIAAQSGYTGSFKLPGETTWTQGTALGIQNLYRIAVPQSWKGQVVVCQFGHTVWNLKNIPNVLAMQPFAYDESGQTPPPGDPPGGDPGENGPTLTAIKVTDPAHGTVTLNSDGGFTYTPASDYIGPDSFTYKANDGTTDSNVATVSITVQEGNDPPVAVNDSYETNEDTPLTVAVPGVLLNDTDEESAPEGYGTGTYQFDYSRVSYSQPMANAAWRFGRNPDAYFIPQTSGTIYFDAGCEGHDTPFIVDSNGATLISAQVGTGNYDYSETISERTWHMKHFTLSVQAGQRYYARFSGGFNRFKMLSNIVVFNERNYDDFDNYAYPTHYFYVPLGCDEILFTDGYDANGAFYKPGESTPVYGTPTGTPHQFSVAVKPEWKGQVIACQFGHTVWTITNPVGPVALQPFTYNEPVLTASKVSDPAHGTVTLNSNGSFTYTPDANFNGPDHFTYKANDGLADSNVATVFITVLPVNDAPVAVDDNYSTDKDTPLNVAPPGVLENDYDVDGDPLLNQGSTFQFDYSRVTYTQPMANAAWRFGRNPDAYFIPSITGTISFDAGCEGHDTPFIVDSNGATLISAQVGTGNYDYSETISGRTWHMKHFTLSVQAGQRYYARFNGGFNRFKMLSEIVVFNERNYDDFDNYAYPAHYFYVPLGCNEILFTDGYDANGAFYLPGGTVVYGTPTGTPHEFRVPVRPEWKGQVIACQFGHTVWTITNPAGPVALQPFAYQEFIMNAGKVTDPAHGTVTLNADGSFLYTPVSGYIGPDSFTYKVSDGLADSNVATVTITVQDVNHPPVANNDSYETNEDTPLTVAPPGVLANDTDADNPNPFQFDFSRVSFTQPMDNASWRFGRNPDGYFVAPMSGTISFDAGNEAGNSTFTLDCEGSTLISTSVGTGNYDYTETIGGRTWHMKRFTLAVEAGKRYDFHLRSGFNRFKMLSDIVVFNLNRNDDFDNYAYPTHYLYVPRNGSEILFTDGLAAQLGYTGTFYLPGDATRLQGTATGTTNQYRIAVPAAWQGQVIACQFGHTAWGIQSPSSVVALQPFAYDELGLTAIKVSDPAHGTLTLNSDGSFTYTPDANYNGPDSFTYKANDGQLDSNVATVTINVLPVNDAPVANNDSYSTDSLTPLSVVAPGVLGNDTDVDGDPLTAALVTNPIQGTVTFNTDGSFDYLPFSGYTGTDSFTYQVSDGEFTSTATVTITVTAP